MIIRQIQERKPKDEKATGDLANGGVRRLRNPPFHRKDTAAGS
jgi:hypothetical protein